jgi:hypothetical protein
MSLSINFILDQILIACDITFRMNLIKNLKSKSVSNQKIPDHFRTHISINQQMRHDLSAILTTSYNSEVIYTR